MARAMRYFLPPCGLIFRACSTSVVSTFMSRTGGKLSGGVSNRDP
jgi:hypothetical protein